MATRTETYWKGIAAVLLLLGVLCGYILGYVTFSPNFKKGPTWLDLANWVGLAFQELGKRILKCCKTNSSSKASIYAAGAITALNGFP